VKLWLCSKWKNSEEWEDRFHVVIIFG